MKNNKLILKILVVILIIIFLFYWYEIRPIGIRKDCIQFADDKATSVQGDQTDVRYFYWKCLAQKGLMND